MAKVSLRAYNREIEAMIDRGQFDEAIAHCRHILKTYPKHLETYRLLGKAYLESRRYGDAVDIFSRILATAPNDFVAQVGMSIIRDEENKLEDAIWHMERAFETQPSNPAIQAELQRLYARRDGVKPPRIRMTRGALANMYVQGELYPQAISEIRSVLKDDPERADMQILLARALYKSGSKNEAADVATSQLRRYPYSLDANRVLVEILGSEHPENAQMYRQRVFEMDPYAAQVAGSIFLAHEVSDAAVNVDRLEWDGQPVALQPDWSDQAISPETGEQPDWSEPSSFGGIQSAPETIFGSQAPAEPPPDFGRIESAPVSIFGAAAPADQPPAEQEDEIPDFLRAAGWGAATGVFDESKPAFAEEEEAGSAGPIAQGDLPDWVKAMKPPEPGAAKPERDEELPDWIKAIGVGAIASQALDRDEKDEQQAEAGAPQAASEEETTQWLSSESAPVAASAASEEGLSSEFAWLDAPAETGSTPAGAGEDDLDWLKDLNAGEPAFSTPQEESNAEDLDWLRDLNASDAAPRADESDWLKTLGQTEAAPAAEQPGLLKSLESSEAEPAAPRTEEPDWLSGAGEPAPSPELEQEETPDWLKGAVVAGGGGAISYLAGDDQADESKAEPGLESTPPVAAPGELGVSEQEQDDAFAWLEGLAAKQGASEGLLTKPEDRLEEEPEWVKQAKDLNAQGPASTIVPPELAQAAAGAALLSEAESGQPADVDETETWLKDLTGEQLPPEPASAVDETALWLKDLEQEQAFNTGQPAETPETDMPDWMKNIQVAPEEQSPTIFAEETDLSAAWLPPMQEPEAEEAAESKAEEEGLPSWLGELDQEEQQISTPARADDLPAWLLADEAAPAVSEPTISSDWKPVEEDQVEPAPEPLPAAPFEMAEAETVLEPAPTEPEPVMEAGVPAAEPEPAVGGPSTPPVDPVLAAARSELSENNLNEALGSYDKLIKKARNLDEVIYDLREASYRHPVDVNLWQSLGDAYMRANRLQDALDAYTKAEELLR